MIKLKGGYFLSALLDWVLIRREEQGRNWEVSLPPPPPNFVGQIYQILETLVGQTYVLIITNLIFTITTFFSLLTTSADIAPRLIGKAYILYKT